jgi:hypothetical protein
MTLIPVCVLRACRETGSLLRLEALVLITLSRSRAGLYSDFEHTIAANAQRFEKLGRTTFFAGQIAQSNRPHRTHRSDNKCSFEGVAHCATATI